MQKDLYGVSAFPLKQIAGKIAVIVVAIVVIVLIWFAVSWQIGNMFADFTRPSEANAASAASTAISLSPRDPLATWLKASLAQDEDTADYSGFEDVVRLSPADYRWWIQLGRAYEQADQIKKAEDAFLQANRLAPNYVVPKWQMGNFYLRTGNGDKALQTLTAAAQLDPSYREQIFSIAWDFYDKDRATLDSIAGSSPAVLAGLAKFYASKGLADYSYEAWQRIPKEKRQSELPTAELIAQAFYDKGLFLTSSKFLAEVDPKKAVENASLANPGFETALTKDEKAFFAWKINAAKNLRIRTTGFKKRTGKRSLELDFNAFNEAELYNVYKTVALEGGKSYRLRFWVKTESLVSKGLPLMQIINAIDGKSLAESTAFSAGSTEWVEKTVTFSVPPTSEGISIRTTREFCGENCFLNGKVFYDDFSLEVVGS